jgi:hypothetical protein
LQLFDRGSTKRIACREHDFKSLLFQQSCELADRRGLAGAVDADDENRKGRSSAVDYQRLLSRRQDVEQRTAQRAEQRVQIGELLALNLAAQFVENTIGRLDADVCSDQPRFELVEHRVVDAACRQQVREVVGQP